MSTFFSDHILGPDTHANRPAATGTGSAPYGALYECTTHNLIYKNAAGTWVTWATPGVADPTTTKGDLITRGASALGRKAVGTDGQFLSADSTQADGLAWAAPPSVIKTINAQTGTTYTLVIGDVGKFVTMTNAAASTLTVPPNSSVAFTVGTVIEGAQLGAGQVTLTPGSGVTINGTPGLKLAAQYGTFGLLKTATDTWLAYGRLSA